MPFEIDGKTEIDLLESITKFNLDFSDKRPISKELKEFIEIMLAKEPSTRASLEDLLNSSFLSLKEDEKKDDFFGILDSQDTSQSGHSSPNTQFSPQISFTADDLLTESNQSS